MKKKIRNIIIGVISLIIIASSCFFIIREKKEMKDFGTVVNIDDDFLSFIYKGNGNSVENATQQMKDYVDFYANHGISDLVFNIFGQTSITPSKKWTWRGDKISWTEENGIPVDYSNHEHVVPAYEYFTNGDCEPVEVLLEETKKRGMNAWLSFRMNDIHCPYDETSYLRGTEFYEFSGEGQKIKGNRNGYYDNVFNYEDEEIRNRMLAYLKEQIDRYDMYGIELDFQREIMCFAYWENEPEYYCNIMNEFIRTVRGYLNEREKTVGHKIKLMIRVTRSIENNIIFGFDAEQWVKEGIVDVIVPTPRWGTADSDMPIKDWKKLVEGTGVEIYAGQELMLAYEILPGVTNSLEVAKGLASAYYESGADKAYLFNFFYTYVGESKDEEKINANKMLQQTWEAISNPKKANSGVKRHIVTYEENDTLPKGQTPYRPLPSRINNGFNFPMQLGKIEKKDDVTVYLIVSTNAKVTGVSINGVALQQVEDVSGIYVNNPFPNSTVVAFSGKGGKMDGGQSNIVINTNGGLILNYLEVKVN